jgi:signal transduction histidine kinase
MPPNTRKQRKWRFDLRGQTVAFRFSVSDDGVGCTREQVGTLGGLGLINIRERVLQLDGRFEFHSEPGRGTTLRVTVPFRADS